MILDFGFDKKFNSYQIQNLNSQVLIIRTIPKSKSTQNRTVVSHIS